MPAVCRERTGPGAARTSATRTRRSTGGTGRVQGRGGGGWWQAKGDAQASAGLGHAGGLGAHLLDELEVRWVRGKG
ncbi:MAG: hypothetical protein ABIP77_08210, partial [Candidatus Limnocylindrales bacterium]